MAGNAPQGRHQAPARGVLAGIKADAQRAKDLNQPFDPNSVGSAWSHNFLNQKPWHPLNFRNQARVYEAEQQAIRDKKTREQAKSEFEAEQEYMKTLSYLSVEEQEKYRARQSVSFMYTKPPGMDVQVDKPKEAGAGEEKGGGAGLGPSGVGQGGRREQRAREPRSHVVNVLGAIAALHANDKWEVKHVSSAGLRSPARGDVEPGAANQQFVLPGSDEDEEDGAGPAESGEGLQPQESKRERKRRKLEEAEAVLRAAGLLDAATKLHGGGKADKDKGKKKKKSTRDDEDDRKRKKSKKHKSKDS